MVRRSSAGSPGGQSASGGGATSPGGASAGGFAVPSDSGSTLKELEKMIATVGGASPAALSTVQQQQRALATSATRAVVSKATQQRDCLDAEQQRVPDFRRAGANRSLGATPSMMRGASMAGRDRAEKRFIGNGFQPPPAESPGPIYKPPQGFAEDATANRSGYSFGTAPRQAGSPGAGTTASSAAASSYAVTSSLGRQSTSNVRTASAAPFSRAARFSDKIFLSGAHAKAMHSSDTPGPAAYNEDITRLPSKGPRAPAALLLSSKESSRKAFISKAHVVDSMGSATAGADFGGAVNLSQDSRHRSSPSFSFGTGKRDAGVSNDEPLIASPHAGDSSDPKAMTKAKRQALARAAMRSSKAPTPGPGEYIGETVSTVADGRGPKAVFPAASKSDKLFWSKDLSTRRGGDSPGMRYSPKYSAVDRSTPGARIAKDRDREPHKSHDRFAHKEFIGKAFAGGLGSASPGPVYEQPAPPRDGPKYTMVGKEQHFERKVFPGPTRPRWVSRESAKDNLGAYGPGPKYDVRGDISKDGPKFGFGTAARGTGATKQASSTGDEGGRPDSASRRPPRSQSADVPGASSASAGGGGGSPRAHIPGPRIVPPTTVPRASPREVAMDERRAASPPVHPRYRLAEPEAPKVSFTKSSRFGPKVTVGQQGNGPGPVYNVNYRLMEGRVPGGSFGGLP